MPVADRFQVLTFVTKSKSLARLQKTVRIRGSLAAAEPVHRLPEGSGAEPHRRGTSRNRAEQISASEHDIRNMQRFTGGALGRIAVRTVVF